ncbi:MAG: CHASE2 domain-containing protein [Oscillatoria sp. SIO1A7]|nr:CHASE2 domain-containing protein [Oscillatoria sp. SIO1A7]
MDKLVKLSLDGQLELGYQVELVEIKEDGRDGRTLAEGVSGSLPPASQVYDCYRAWQQKYNGLDSKFRALKKVGYRKLPTEISVESGKEAADRFKQEFNDWLDDRGFHKIENMLRTHLSVGDRIRFVIKTTDYRLWQLPWSEWDFFEDYRRAEVAFSPLEFKGVERSISITPRKQVRILAVGGDSTSIDYQADRDSLRRLRSAGAEPEFLNQPTPKEVRDVLWMKKWDIFFYAGHSESEANIQTGRLYLGSDTLELKDLDNSFKNAVERGLKLVILNSCDGLGLARQLVTEFGVPLVIAMREQVPDRVAQQFLEYFLLAYARQKQPLYVAVRQARQRIADEWGERLPSIDWLPAICQNPGILPPTWAGLFRPVSIKQLGTTSLAAALLVMVVRFFGLLQPLELGAFDQLMRMRPDEGMDDRFLVVKVTEEDIQERKEYPISDRTMLQLLRKLEQHEPRVIGLGIYRDIPKEPGHAELKAYLSQSDRLVAICLAGDLKTDQERPNQIDGAPPPGMAKQRVGFSDLVVDLGGIVRRHLFYMVPIGSPCNNVNYALSAQLAFRYLRAEGIKPKSTSGDLQLGDVIFKDLEKHTGFYQRLDDRGEQVLLNYRSSENIAEQVSLSEVLAGKLEPGKVKDRIVLIGLTAPSVGDRLPTPYGSGLKQQLPGVFIHAHMASQMISAVLDDRPLLWFWPWWGDGLWIGFWSLVGGLLVWGLRLELHQVFAGVFALGSLYGICFVVLLATGGCLPLVPSAIALVTTSGTIVVRYSKAIEAVKSMLLKTIKSDDYD